MENTHGKWEKRWHPLRQEWIVYAAHRNSRPWSGEVANGNSEAAHSLPHYDPTCYLCPCNTRINGATNPQYEDVFVFENDHPVVGMNAPDVVEMNAVYKRSPAKGIAKVVCFDPRHDLTLAQMPLAKVEKVFEVWQQETHVLAQHPSIESVLIFENKGEMVGVSNPHPHGQIYAMDFPLRLVELAQEAAQKHKLAGNGNLFADIIKAEQQDQIRIVAENEHAIAFVPFFARYAYEVMVFPKQQHATLATMPLDMLHGFAAVYHQVIRRYDLLFRQSFPYVMSLLQAPLKGQHPDFYLHILLQPPLRQPNVRKFLAGPEIGGGNFMADTMPEDKAAELRAVST